MPPHHFVLSKNLVLILVQCLHFVTSQSTAQYNLPASATSSLTASSSPTVVASYNFTYPSSDEYESGIQASYKDTIDVTWFANGSPHAPVLQIQCWNRNDSSGFIYYENPSSYTHSLSTSPPSFFPLLLTPYREYSPCLLQLQDPQGSESVTSVAIFITQLTNASTGGVTWGVDHQAPKVAVDAGVATATTGGTDHKSVMGGMWAFVGAMAALTVLL